MLVHVPPLLDDVEPVLEAFGRVVPALGIPLVVVAPVADRWIDPGVPVMRSVEEAVAALASVEAYAQWRRADGER